MHIRRRSDIKMERQTKKKILRLCCRMIFLAYLVFLLKIVLFKYKGLGVFLRQLGTGEWKGFRSYNSVPFRSILESIKMIFHGQFSRGLANMAGNIFLFVPLGYFLPLLEKRYRKWETVLLTGFLISLLLEAGQYFLYLGSADIDDVLLNLSGTALGFLFFNIIKLLTYRKEIRRYAATLLLSAVGFAAAGYLAVDYFGIMFGIMGQNRQITDGRGGGNTLTGHPKGEGAVSYIGSGKEANEKTDREADKEAAGGAGDKAAQRDAEKTGRGEGESGGEELYGLIMELDGSRLAINVIEVQDLGEGRGIASINMEKPNIQTVYLNETTKYTQKDIYDANGDKVVTRDAGKEDLETDKTIAIKGRWSGDRFYAEEVEIKNFLFQ